MPTKRRKARQTTEKEFLAHQARDARRRFLARAVRGEKQIQRLARRLEVEMQTTNDRLQALALTLGSRARAIEAERDIDRSLVGAEK